MTTHTPVSSSANHPTAGNRYLWWGLGVGAVLMFVGLVFYRSSAPSESSKPVEVALEELKRIDGRFFLLDGTNTFSGVVVELYEEGGLKSRTEVKEGLLAGLSEGWYESGQLQVQEFFVGGVASGRKTKWWENGQMLSEGQVVEGQWEGLYRKWHENGQLSQQIPMKAGKAHGVAKAWFPSGALKSRVELVEGEPMKKEYFDDVAAPREERVEDEESDPRG